MHNLPHISQDPCADDFVQNPYASYKNWQHQNFYFWDNYNLIISARYEVVNTLLRDRRFGRQAPEGFCPQIPEHLKPFYDFESRSMLERDGKDHIRLRSLVLRAFTSRRIEGLRQDIQTLCQQLIQNFPKGEFDLIKHYAEPIPVTIIARMIGVPENTTPQLLSWSHDMVAMYQANRSQEIENRALKATEEFSAYIRKFAENRRTTPGSDLISELLAVEAEGEKLTQDELITTVILLLNAGHEATVHAIANGVKTLLQSQTLPSSETLTSLTEETLRYDPPLHMFTRYAHEDIEIFGHQFHKGDQIGLLLGAACHDRAKYPKPETFTPHRNPGDHPAFGAGAHFCIGAPLARLEISIAFEELFNRCPSLQLTRPSPYADRYHFHGMEALWVKT